MATATPTKKPAAKKAATGTAVAVKKTGAVVDVKAMQEALRQQAADMNSRVAPASGIGIQVGQDKKFKFPDGTKGEEFTAVILDFVNTNNFYEGAFDKDNIQPPACFAIGVETNNKLVPSDNSPNKQAPACAECPMNEFGSAGKGKACKNGAKLAVLPPDADENTPIWTINVSPTALKAWGSYVRSVSASMQMPPIAVVTTFSFDDAVDYPSLRFGDPVPNENLAVHYARREEATKILIAEPDVSSYEAAQAKTKKPQRGGARR